MSNTFNTLYGIKENQQQTNNATDNGYSPILQSLYSVNVPTPPYLAENKTQESPFEPNHRYGLYDWLSDRNFNNVDQSRKAALLKEYRETVVPMIAETFGEDTEAAKQNFDAQLPVQIKDMTRPIERGWWEAANDNVVIAGNAIYGLAKSVSDVIDPDSAVSKGLQGLIDSGNNDLSTYLKDQQLRRTLDKADAKGDYGKELAADLDYYKRNVSAGVSEVLGNLGAMAATAVAGGYAGGAVGLGTLGARAAMGLTGILSGAGEVRGNIYDHIMNMPEDELRQSSSQYNVLLNYGYSPENARKTVATDLQKNWKEVAGGAALGALDAFGGAEKVLAGGVSKGLLKTMGSEAAQEAIQEGGGQLLSNVAIRRDDPKHDLFDSVVSNAGTGALLGAAGGGLVHSATSLGGQSGADKIVNATAQEVAQQQAAQDGSGLLAIPQAEQNQANQQSAANDINAEIEYIASNRATNEAEKQQIVSELSRAIQAGTVENLAQSSSLANNAAQMFLDRQTQKAISENQSVEAETPSATPIEAPTQTEQVNQQPIEVESQMFSDGNAVVLQNRDRSTPQSIEQMNAIAANPDYGRLLDTRSMSDGAPIVEENPSVVIPESQKGLTSYVVDSKGNRTPIQYAVVEADTLLPSHRVDGMPYADYASGNATQMRAIGGNGRVAGLQAAYQRGTAGNYKEGIATETAGTGINGDVVRGMKNPILVRIMPQQSVTADIGDRTNTTGTAQLNPVEQARNDVKRINVSALSFNEDGSPSAESVRGFVQAMPQSERSGLLDQNGAPTRQAVDRIMSALFYDAYGDADILNLYAASTDPEIKNVLLGMARAAGAMSKLKGAGALDIRDIVIEAAKMAANAKRSGVALKDLAQQADLDANPEVYAVAEMLANNARSAKRIGDVLQEVADFAYDEAIKPDFDLMGEVPKASRQDVIERFKNVNEQQSQSPVENSTGSVNTTEGDEQGAVERTRPRTPEQAETSRPSENRQSERQPEPVNQDEQPSSNDEGFSFEEEISGEEQDKLNHVNEIKQSVIDAVGEENAQHIEILTQEEAERPDGVQSLNLDGVEGYYNPKTGVITLIADNLTKDTAGFVAWHELGHRGIDAYVFKRYKALIKRSGDNATVNELTNKIIEARKGTGDPAENNRLIAIEEAIVELLAAKNTGNWSHLESKYGVTIPAEFKRKQPSLLTRIMRQLREIFSIVKGRRAVSNEEVINLLKMVNASIEAGGKGGANTKFSRNGITKQKYEQRIDELFSGSKANIHGVHLLDKSDVLDLLGYGDYPVQLDEAKVILNQKNHPEMTADEWKKVPEWIDNPAVVLISRTHSKRLVFVPEQVIKGAPVYVVVEPEHKGLKVHALINSYAKDGDIERAFKDIEKDIRNGNAQYVDTKKASNLLGRSGLQLPRLPSLSTSHRRILTEKQLNGYKKAHENQNNTQNTTPPLQFSRVKPLGTSFEDAEKSLGGRPAYEKAKNEGKTELSYENWVLVRTPAFRRWFGNWERHPEQSSKVINPRTGEPLVVFHGTTHDFSTFKTTGLRDAGWFGKGFYATESVDDASEYSLYHANQYDPRGYFKVQDENIAVGANVMPLFVNIRTPFVFDTVTKVSNDMAEDIKNNHDGVIKFNGDILEEVMAYKPSQLKSALGNNGEFNADNDDILYSRKSKPSNERKLQTITKAERLEKLRKAPSIHITGNEIEASDDLKQYKKNALEYGKKLRGTYTNKDTGQKIFLDAGGIKEALQHDYKDKAHLQSIAAIPKIIEDAIYIETLKNEDTDKHPNIQSYDYYVAGLNIGGEAYTVKAVIAVAKDGSRYYDHKLSKIEKGELLSRTGRITNPADKSSSPFKDFYDKRLLQILQEGNEENNVTEQKYSRKRDSNTPLVDKTPTVREIARTMTDSSAREAIKSFFTEGGKAVQPKWLETLTTLVFDDKAPITNILRRFKTDSAKALEFSLRTFQAATQKTTDMFLKAHYDPMMETLKSAWQKDFKKLYKDFGNDGWKQFLMDIGTVGNLVKHGRERNAEILRKTEGRDKAGSGRTDEEIDAIEQTFKEQVPGLIEFYESLYKKHLKPMLDYRDKTLLDAGLLTQEMLDARPSYEWYVPLYGNPNEDGNNGFFYSPAPEIRDIKDKKAKGRSGTLADNVLQNVMTATQTAIKRAGQQTLLYRLFDFVDKNPAGRNLMQAKVNTPDKKEIFEKIVDKDGMVQERVKPSAALDKDTIVFRNGNTVQVMKIGNKRILEALQGLNKAQMEGLFALTAKSTRGLSAIYTRYSPTFPVMNKIRDTMSQLSFILADAPVKNPVKVAMKVLAYNAQFTAQWRKNPNSEYYKWRERYERAGGATMYIDVFKDDVMRNISEDFAKGVGATTIHQFKYMKDGVAKFVDGINEHFEMTSRVAVFRGLVEGGMSEQDALLYTKNLMNFETKGKYGQQMGAIYAFANAALFDARRMMQSLRTPRGAMVMAIHIGMMYVLYGALKALGGNDEDGIARLNKVPLTSAGRSFIVIDSTDPEGKGFKLPVGFGFGRISYTIAAAIHRFEDGVDSKEEFLGNILNVALVDNLSPLEPIDISPSKETAKWLAQQFAPTVLRPVIQLSQNTTGQGAPIHMPDEWIGEGLKFEKAYPNTNQIWRDIAKFVYDKTGYDSSPETYRFLTQSYFGSGGTEVARGLMLLNEKVGTELSLGDIPLGQAFAHKGDRYDLTSYMKRKQQVKRLKAEREYEYENGRGNEFDLLHPGVEYLSQLFKETDKEIKKLQKERKTYDEIQDPLEKQRKIKEITQKMRMLYMSANKAVRDYDESQKQFNF